MKYNPKIHHRKSIRKKGYDYARKGLYFITICCQDRICRFGKVVNGKMQLNAFGQIAHDEWMRTCKLRDNVELGEFVIMPNHMHGIIRITRRGVLDFGNDEIRRRGVSHTPQNPAEHENPDIISNLNMERGCPPISDDYDHRNEMDLKNDNRGVLDFGNDEITRRGVSHTPQNPAEHENPDFISNSNMERGCSPISDDYDHWNEMDLKNDNRGVLDFGNDNRGVLDFGNDLRGVLDFGNDLRGVCDTPLRSPSNTIGAMVRGYKSAVTRQIRLLGFTGKLWQRNYHERIIRTDLAYYRISRYIRENPGNW